MQADGNMNIPTQDRVSGLQYMLQLIGAETPVTVFTNNIPNDSYIQFQKGYSFKTSSKSVMTYQQFLQTFISETYPGSVVMKTESFDHSILVKLLQDMELPSFYTDIADLEAFEFI